MNASRWCGCLAVVLVAAACKSSLGDESPSPEPSPLDSSKSVSNDSPQPKSEPPGTYLGRKIAPTMSHLGADWLVRPEREQEERTSLMLEQLKLKPGDVACDLGSGNGYHTLAMARLVSPKGRAIGIDIQPEMIELLKERAKEEGIKNLEAILSDQDDPKIPAGTCDMILLADVYHELDDPAGMLQDLKPALSARGVIAMLEFKEEDPDVPIKPLHKMSKKQIVRELEANGYRLVRAFDGLPWQHLMFFSSREAVP